MSPVPGKLPSSSQQHFLTQRLLGDAANYSFEQRIFHAVMLLIAFTGLTTVTYDFVLGNHPSQIVVSAFCAAFPLGCYLYARKTHSFQVLIKPSILFFYTALSVGWFVTNGLHGSLPFFFFMLVVYCVVYAQRPFHWAIPGVVGSVIAFIVIEWYLPQLFIRYDSALQAFFDTGISLVLCLIINGAIVHVIFTEYIRERRQKDEMIAQMIKDRQIIDAAHHEIRVLRGLLPICAQCKKIRDDQGAWQELEAYIHTHSEATFSHGICPDCARHLYADLYLPSSNQSNPNAPLQ